MFNLSEQLLMYILCLLGGGLMQLERTNKIRWCVTQQFFTIIHSVEDPYPLDTDPDPCRFREVMNQHNSTSYISLLNFPCQDPNKRNSLLYFSV
jgi:hypothetical protein